MPDGSHLLFTNENGNYTLFDSKVANKKISKDLSLFRTRIRTLKEIKRNLKSNTNVGESLVKFSKLIHDIKDKGFDGLAPLPKGKAERAEAIENLVTQLNLKIQLKIQELKGLQDCDVGKDPTTGGNFSWQVISAKDGSDTIVGVVVSTPAKSGKITWKNRWFCVALPGYTAATPRFFSSNPCANGGQAIANCTSLVAKGFIGYIEKFTTYSSEPIPGSLDEAINRATERMNSAPITGRVRGKTGAPGVKATDNDRCS